MIGIAHCLPAEPVTELASHHMLDNDSEVAGDVAEGLNEATENSQTSNVATGQLMQSLIQTSLAQALPFHILQDLQGPHTRQLLNILQTACLACCRSANAICVHESRAKSLHPQMMLWWTLAGSLCKSIFICPLRAFSNSFGHSLAFLHLRMRVLISKILPSKY